MTEGVLKGVLRLLHKIEDLVIFFYKKLGQGGNGREGVMSSLIATGSHAVHSFL